VLEVIDDYLEEYKTTPEALSVHLCDVCNKIKSLLDKRENEAAMMLVVALDAVSSKLSQPNGLRCEE